MLTVLLLCVIYGWEPMEGPVDRYEIWLDGEPYATLMPVVEPTVEVCVSDSLPHVVSVRAFDFAGNSSEVLDPTLPRVIQSDFPRAPLPINVRADLFGDGIVGFDDFGGLIQAFGACNSQLREVPCS